MDDETLYQQLRRGDETALTQLVERHHRALFTFLYRLTNNRTLAEDLTQDTFARLLTYQSEPPRRFRAWLFTIGRNLAHDVFRSASYRREESQEFVDHQQQDTTPEAAAIESDQRRAVADVLQQLPDAQREVLILRFYHDMKLEEIAEITGAPLGTVKSRLFHALKGAKRFLAGMMIYE